MNPDFEKEFDQNMNQLVHLLKKIIKGLPVSSAAKSIPSKENKDSGTTINFCFFNFLPITDEEMDEVDALYEQFLAQEEKSGDSSLELNSSDKDFLRQHGIRF